MGSFGSLEQPVLRRAKRTRFSGMGVFLALILLGQACGPSQEEMDAERAKVRDLEEQLRKANGQKQALDDHVKALQAQNASMASRLRALGQNVEELEGNLDETRRALEELRERQKQAQARLQVFRDLLAKFKAMIESGELRVRIVRNRMVVELPEGILFDSGQAVLKKGGETTLSKVAKVLKQIPDREFQVAGHTDNVPIKTSRFPSNWELSTARAVNVTTFLVKKGGLDRGRLSAAGYADTQPVASNDTDEGRQQNRRIEIVLVPNLDELPDLSSLEGGSPASDAAKPAASAPSKGDVSAAKPEGAKEESATPKKKKKGEKKSESN